VLETSTSTARARHSCADIDPHPEFVPNYGAKVKSMSSDDVARIEAFLSAVPEPAQSALRKLRAQIKAAAPEAEEYMGYGVPAFRHNGALVSYGAAKAYCSFYVQSPKTMEAFADDLTAFKTSGIAFQPEKPVPAALVKRIVKARLMENAGLRAKTKLARS
jgi:uncharacterized protein YdhG (YjbR/CyaY superfamily)